MPDRPCAWWCGGHGSLLDRHVVPERSIVGTPESAPPAREASAGAPRRHAGAAAVAVEKSTGSLPDSGDVFGLANVSAQPRTARIQHSPATGLQSRLRRCTTISISADIPWRDAPGFRRAPPASASCRVETEQRITRGTRALRARAAKERGNRTIPGHLVRWDTAHSQRTSLVPARLITFRPKRVIW